LEAEVDEVLLVLWVLAYVPGRLKDGREVGDVEA
jgi:hypothetical protein